MDRASDDEVLANDGSAEQQDGQEHVEDMNGVNEQVSYEHGSDEQSVDEQDEDAQGPDAQGADMQDDDSLPAYDDPLGEQLEEVSQSADDDTTAQEGTSLEEPICEEASDEATTTHWQADLMYDVDDVEHSEQCEQPEQSELANNADVTADNHGTSDGDEVGETATARVTDLTTVIETADNVDDIAIVADVERDEQLDEDVDTTSDETIEDLDISTKKHKHKKRSAKRLWIIITSIVFALMVIAGGTFLFLHYFFSHRAAPGVSFANTSVTGKTADELVDVVNNAVNATSVKLVDDQGSTTMASLKDLGVKVDVDATVVAILSAKTNVFDRINPFSKVDLGLQATSDDETLNAFMTRKFVEEEDVVIPSSIAYNAETDTFDVTVGKDGTRPVVKPIQDVLETLVAEPNQTQTIKLTYETVAMPISEETANRAADNANAMMGTQLSVSNTRAKTLSFDHATIVSWLDIQSDEDKGTIDVSVNADAVKSYMSEHLSAELNQAVVTQKEIVDNTGAVLWLISQGVDGVEVTQSDDVAQKVVDALQTHQDASIEASVSVTDHPVSRTVQPIRIVVNKSQQLVYVYRDSVLLKVFEVCTGATGVYPTNNGTFQIYLRRAIQDMTGFNSDGSRYFSPGVQWISYFDGGISFHAAPWNVDEGIPHGYPARYGSHGCVGMYPEDAQWLFDNCPVGSVVQVIGNDPWGPVR